MAKLYFKLSDQETVVVDQNRRAYAYQEPGIDELFWTWHFYDAFYIDYPNIGFTLPDGSMKGMRYERVPVQT